MTITVQELKLKLKLESFGDGATIQVADEGVLFQIAEIKKDEDDNAVIVLESDDEDDDE